MKEQKKFSIDDNDNTLIILTLKEAQTLKGKISKDKSVQLLIEDASELSVEQLDNLIEAFNINSIKIDTSKQTLSKQQKVPYDVDTYRKCREAIDELLQGIDLNTQGPDRDIKIFGEVIKRLAKHISFDYSSLHEEKKKERQELEKIYMQPDIQRVREDKRDFIAKLKLNQIRNKSASETNITCGNMVGGLLNNTSYCAGFAEIVRNVFACCGIEAVYIRGRNKMNMNSGHAWNQIKLDGIWYNTDLAWDRDAIVDEKPTKYTLKSDKDFGHTKYDTSNSIKHNCPTSLETSEVEQYIYGKSLGKEEEHSDETKQQDSEVKYYVAGEVEQDELEAVNLLKVESQKKEILKELESDLTESEIRKSYELLAKTKEKSEKTTSEKEENYGNR